ncbi:hypothetical protein GCK72_001834 [Caenorhabditis remanei]|uniref:Vacuolar ATPase assembly protein VMA22 n=1 Tax=Caenorhabditis remanei TaxID=31234 RepID=A0A2P4VDX3_CAERE|nr:hypothetical protein GCK72_001834 [Caenorhabditis remanei]KAF1770017.1 hypothetical protein GCK72_001834 [Caenorhabditis remanei]
MTVQSIKRKNELYLEKMELTDKFVTLHEKLQNELSLASLCISKAKTTHGISLFSVNSFDSHDLEPSVRIDVDNGKFTIVKELEEEETKKEKEETDEGEDKKKKDSGESEDVEDSEAKKSPFAGQFRPFGVLESTAAKDARKIYKSAIQTIVDLVSTQQSIISKTHELTDN